MDAAKVKATEARCYRAEEAQSLGLIDTIASPKSAAQVFYDELSGSVQPTEEKENAMSDATTKPGDKAGTEAAAAEAAASARTAEKARIKSIMDCEEAKGKTALATHLAMDTDMSLDTAKGILKASAAEKQETADTTDRFKQTMDKDNHPNVGADGNKGGGDGKVDEVAEVMRDYSNFTGEKFGKD